MLTAPEDVRYIICQTPEWVAARLWERAPSPLSPTARLRLWVDHCSLLDDRAFTPAGAWTTGATEVFRDAALDVLGSDRGLFGWEELRSRLLRRLSVTSSRSVDEVQHYVPPIPLPYVDRYLWLGRRNFEHTRDDYETCGDLWHLVTSSSGRSKGHWAVGSATSCTQGLFSLAADRPELLEFITLRVRQSPILFADMLLEPRLARSHA